MMSTVTQANINFAITEGSKWSILLANRIHTGLITKVNSDKLTMQKGIGAAAEIQLDEIIAVIPEKFFIPASASLDRAQQKASIINPNPDSNIAFKIKGHYTKSTSEICPNKFRAIQLPNGETCLISELFLDEQLIAILELDEIYQPEIHMYTGEILEFQL